jgi:hypothetical protein
VGAGCGREPGAGEKAEEVLLMADTLLLEIVGELEKVTDAIGALGTAAMQPMPVRDRAVLYVRLADARLELERIRDWAIKEPEAPSAKDGRVEGEAESGRINQEPEPREGVEQWPIPETTPAPAMP